MILLLKLTAAAVFLIPAGFVAVAAAVAFSYRGPLVAAYVVGALLVAALCGWPALAVLRGRREAWTALTWGFLVVDACLAALTLLPFPSRR